MVRKPDGAMVIVLTPRDLSTRHRQWDAALDEVPVEVGALAAAWAGDVWQEEAASLRLRILKMKNIYCKVNSTSSARDSTN